MPDNKKKQKASPSVSVAPPEPGAADEVSPAEPGAVGAAAETNRRDLVEDGEVSERAEQETLELAEGGSRVTHRTTTRTTRRTSSEHEDDVTEEIVETITEPVMPAPYSPPGLGLYPTPVG